MKVAILFQRTSFWHIGTSLTALFNSRCCCKETLSRTRTEKSLDFSPYNIQKISKMLNYKKTWSCNTLAKYACMSSNAFMETHQIKVFIWFHLAQTQTCHRSYNNWRSSNDSTLIVAHVGRNCIGDKSFYVTAPHLRNALPRNILEAKSLTVFKKMLKSHYPKYWLVLCLYLHFLSTLAVWSRWKGAFTNVCMYVHVCVCAQCTFCYKCAFYTGYAWQHTLDRVVM